MKRMVKELRIERGEATEVQNLEVFGFHCCVVLNARGSFVCLP
jgi:hypothetical protein